MPGRSEPAGWKTHKDPHVAILFYLDYVAFCWFDHSMFIEFHGLSSRVYNRSVGLYLVPETSAPPSGRHGVMGETAVPIGLVIPAPNMANNKSFPRGAPMQHLAPRRNPEGSSGHFKTLD